MRDLVSEKTRAGMSVIPIQDATEWSTVQRPADALLSDMDLPLRRRFHPLGWPFEIVTNAHEVLAMAEETFGHARAVRDSEPLRLRVGVCGGTDACCPADPVRRAFSHLYSLVADSANQALLDLKAGTGFIWTSEAAIRNRLYFRSNFLEKAVYLQLGASVVTDLHAACVSRHGRGFLLCGSSGAGKTTLAYACARSGWTYTSDDTSYLINDADPPRVIGHAHRIRFRPAAAALFPELAAHPVTPRMEGKPSIEVRTAELSIPRTTAEATVNFIIVLNRYAGARMHSERLSPGTATARMRGELYSAGDIRSKHEAILEKLWDVPTYRLDYSDLSDAVEALESLACAG